MGQTESQPALSETVVSNLPKRTQQRLSQASRHHQPSSFSFFEAAAVAKTPIPKTPPPPIPRPPKKATSSTASTNEKQQYNSSKGSMSSSMRESILSLSSNGGNLPLVFTEMDGRRYLTSPGTHYLLPTDDDEADRLVILHFLLKYAFKGNVIAPIVPRLKQSKAQVLDIGCGAGTWILEMASDYPSAEFYGIDLVPGFPTSIKPNNAHFSQHNFLATLPFPDNSLDFVHLRFMLVLLTPSQLQALLREISRVLKPLGMIEIVDVDHRIQRPGPTCQSLLNEELPRAFKQHDIDLLQSHQLATLLMSTPYGDGWVDIHQQQVTIPLGWGGQVGQVHAQAMDAFYKSLKPTLRTTTVTRSPPSTWQPPTETHLSDQTIDQALKECLRYQSYLNWFVCHAQKAFKSPSPNNSNKHSAPSLVSTLESGLVPEPHAWDTIDHFIDGFTD